MGYAGSGVCVEEAYRAIASVQPKDTTYHSTRVRGIYLPVDDLYHAIREKIITARDLRRVQIDIAVQDRNGNICTLEALDRGTIGHKSGVSHSALDEVVLDILQSRRVGYLIGAIFYLGGE